MSNDGRVKLISLYGQSNPDYQMNIIEPESYNQFNASEDGVSMSQFDAETNDPTSSFDNEMHSEARGLRGFVKHRRSIQKQRQNRRDLQAKSKATARITRTNAKKKLADTQMQATKQMKGSDASDAALANALASTAVPADTSTGMSSGMKIGLGVGGGLLLLAIVGVVIYKMKHKKP